MKREQSTRPTRSRRGAGTRDSLRRRGPAGPRGHMRAGPGSPRLPRDAANMYDLSKSPSGGVNLDEDTTPTAPRVDGSRPAWQQVERPTFFGIQRWYMTRAAL